MKTTIDIIPPRDNNVLKENDEKQIKIFNEEESVEDLVYEFLRDRTPKTGESYRLDLRDFFRFMKEQFNLPRASGSKVHFDDIKRVHIVKWKNFLETVPSKRGKPFAPNSVNRKLSSVASFYQFLLQREIIDKNPVEFCKRPKRVNIRDTQAFDDEEMKSFFRLVIRKASPLHKGILLTLFTTGMRNHEIRNIKLQDFENREGLKILKYKGKGSKPNQVPIHPVTAYHLGQYLDHMESKGRPIGPEDYLFQPSKSSRGNLNKKLSHTSLGYIVRKWAKKVNINKRITPHSGRATFITSLLNQGEDIYTVARAVAHSSVDTTAAYNKRKQNLNRSPVFGLNFFS